MEKTAKFLFILTITALVVGLSSCDRVRHIIAPGTSEPDAPIPIQERDHIWVVDQNGVEVPVAELGNSPRKQTQTRLLRSAKVSPYPQRYPTKFCCPKESTRMVKVFSGQRGT